MQATSVRLARRLAIVVGALALSAVAIAPAASAATAGTVQPQGRICPAGDGYTYSVGGTTQHVTDSLTAHNATSKTETVTFTNTSGATVSSTFSGSFSVSVSYLIASVNAQFSASYTSSQTYSSGESIPVSTPAGWYAHAKYGEFQRTIYVDQVYNSSSCTQTITGTGTLIADDGHGFTTSVSSSG
jgi:hypothetical protein